MRSRGRAGKSKRIRSRIKSKLTRAQKDRAMNEINLVTVWTRIWPGTRVAIVIDKQT